MSKELRQLLHTIQKKRIREKYAKSPPKKLLYEILHEIEVKKHYGRMRNWELLVELLARWLVLNQEKKVLALACFPACLPFHGLPLKRDKELYEHVDDMGLLESYVKVARENPWDHIGEVYGELGLVGPGQNMTPRFIVQLMLEMTLGDAWKFDAKLFCHQSYREYLLWYQLTHRIPATHIRPISYPMQTQLDPCVGSGRFLFEASILYPKAPLVLFGIEINVSLYRACLVNMALFSNHPYSILCADTLLLPQSCGPAHPVWDLGNRWDPPDMTSFYREAGYGLSPFERYMQMHKPK